MQLRMPRGQVVSPRRRGYAGNCAARQAFFSNFFERFTGPKNQVCRKAAAVIFSVSRALLRKLIVGKIILPKLGRRSEYLIALDWNAAMSARNELIFVRVGRDNFRAARGQTVNYPSVGRNS